MAVKPYPARVWNSAIGSARDVHPAGQARDGAENCEGERGNPARWIRPGDLGRAGPSPDGWKIGIPEECGSKPRCSSSAPASASAKSAWRRVAGRIEASARSAMWIATWGGSWLPGWPSARRLVSASATKSSSSVLMASSAP